MVVRSDGKTDAQFDADAKALSALWEARGIAEGDEPNIPALIFGGEDHTDVLTACLKEAPYEAAAPGDDPDAELRQKQLEAQASLDWAECARVHGFAETKDPAPPQADGYVSVPAALLPASVSAAELDALLKQCPLRPEGSELAAWVGIDTPGFRLDGAQEPDGLSSEDDYPRLTSLAATLNRARFPDGDAE